MRKLTLAILTAALLVRVAFSFAAPAIELYPNAGYVSYIDKDIDIFYVTDFSGHEWSFGEVEDWMIGDVVAMIVDSNGTPYMDDDEVIVIRYVGYFEEEEADVHSDVLLETPDGGDCVPDLRGSQGLCGLHLVS